MKFGNAKPSRQARKAQARQIAKGFIANMKARRNDGEWSNINSPKALKVIERGMVNLIANEGRPFTMQVSHGEAAAFFGDEVDLTGRYAMAFAVDRNGNPYTTLPVCCLPRADYTGPALTADELVAQAEQSAYKELFNEQLGLHPHVPRHVADADRRRP
jgi:hypothetical protein